MSGLDVNKVKVPPQLQSVEAIEKEQPKAAEIQSEVIPDEKPDTFEKSTEPKEAVKETKQNKKTEKTPKTFKEKLARFCKTFVKTGEYLKATGATVIYGGLAAGAIMFSNWLVKGWSKVFKKQIPFKEMFNKPLKCVSKPAKIWAGVAFAAIGGFEFAKAYLKANQHSANVDHKLKTH